MNFRCEYSLAWHIHFHHIYCSCSVENGMISDIRRSRVFVDHCPVKPLPAIECEISSILSEVMAFNMATDEYEVQGWGTNG